MAEPNDSPKPAPAAPRAGWLRRAWAGLFHGSGALLVLSLVSALVLVLAAGSFVSWTLFTEAGNRQALSWVPGLTLVEPRGTVWSRFGAKRLELALPGGWRVVAHEVQWQGLAIRHIAFSLSANGHSIRVDELGAARVEVIAPPVRSTEPLLAPQDLVLPLDIDIGRFSTARLDAPGLSAPLRDLRFGLHLGQGAGAQHRLDDLALTWDRLRLSEGALELGAAAPLPLAARLKLAPATPGTELAEAWSADLKAQGPLTRLQLEATLRARTQSLDARAEARPFEAQPLSALDLRATRFDAHALFSNAPTTALTGTVRAQLVAPAGAASAPGQPLSMQADLKNEQAGRWDAGRVPVRSLVAHIDSDAAKPTQGRIDTLRADLGDAQRSAGQVKGAGQWQLAGEGRERLLKLKAQLELTELQPALIDPRAPALRASGPLAFDVAWPLDNNPRPPEGQLQADLAGRMQDRPGWPAAQVKLDLAGTPRDLQVREMKARAGDAEARVDGRLTQTAAGESPRWKVAGQAQLKAFDPRVWWPAEADSAWRRSAQRYSGDARFDVELPGRSPGDAMRWLAATRGQADLNLADSQFAGVPFGGRLALEAAPGLAVKARAQLKSGANDLQLDGELDPALGASGAADRWRLNWTLPNIDAFAPWLALAGAPVVSGDSAGAIDLAGRWPAAQASGRLDATQLKTSGVTLDGLRSSWKFGSQRDAPLELQADLKQLGLGSGAPLLTALGARVKGSLAAHQAELKGEVTAPPKATADDGSTPPRRARVALAAEGAADHVGDTTTWQGRVTQLDVVDAVEQRSDALLRLLQALPLQVRHASGGPGGGTAVESTGGRLALMGAPVTLQTLRWRHVPGAPEDLQLRARLEPLRVAPLLERTQSGFGWEGDLLVQGHVDLGSNAAGLQADIEFERVSGDLVVNDPDNPGGPLRLGLSDARIAFKANEGRWRLSQRLVGSSLGTLAGEQTVNAPPHALWPSDDAPVQGQLELQGLNLATWGRWVPPGWRLSGEVSTRSRVTGRFAAPEFTGELRGERIAVRNAVEGVDWSDATLAVSLRGSKAKVEQFRVKAGAGTLSITGEATLGEAPRADLRLVADKFAALQRIDRRVVASGEAALGIDAKRLTLTGQLRADEGRIDISRGDAPSLDDDVNVDRGKAKKEAAAASAKNARSYGVDLKIDLGNAFFLRGRGVDTRLAGQLRLTSPGNRLTLNGVIRAEDGTYAAYGQNLSIDRGIITFNGPLENPRLDIEASRANLDIRVGVAIGGTALNPRVRLFSEPEMADADKLSWLVLGRAPDGLGRTDLALLQRAAYALLAGESESFDLLKTIGLDELSVRQGDGEVRETVVSLGKQLSRRWYVGYERSLNATAGTWQLIYRAAQRFTLRAQSGIENSLDLIWTWLWN